MLTMKKTYSAPPRYSRNEWFQTEPENAYLDHEWDRMTKAFQRARTKGLKKFVRRGELWRKVIAEIVQEGPMNLKLSCNEVQWKLFKVMLQAWLGWLLALLVQKLVCLMLPCCESLMKTISLVLVCQEAGGLAPEELRKVVGDHGDSIGAESAMRGACSTKFLQQNWV